MRLQETEFLLLIFVRKCCILGMKWDEMGGFQALSVFVNCEKLKNLRILFFGG